MAKKDQKLSPHQTKDDRVWWYEDPKGMCLMVKFADDYHGIEEILIPWRVLRNALERKDK